VARAFEPRSFKSIRFSKSKYKTKGLEAVLRERFGEESMFGGVPDIPSGYMRKVAVTAATESGERAVIFTNYNRADDRQVGYRMVRQDNPINDLKIREAARATSAAPTYFRPFVNSRTQEAFLDGAVLHNNPVRIANYESKLLWTDAEDLHPDILLSLGTGYHDVDADYSGETPPSHARKLRRKTADQASPAVNKKRSVAFKGFSEVESWVKIFKTRVESILDAELTWRDFRNDVVGKSSPIAAERYIRFNVRTKGPVPKMDDKNQLGPLKTEASNALNAPENRSVVETIAHRLVASSFYFEKLGPMREAGDATMVQGKITCIYRTCLR
jgi:predicted acylesterase/phospholipase RssA